MTNPTKHNIYFFLLLFLPLHMAACNADSKSTHDTLPESLIGLWQVTDVRININSTRTTLYQYNDPRLAGRVFIFSRQAITDNTPENEKCTSPRITKTLIKASELWVKSMGVPVVGDPPGPKDYELPFDNNDKIESIFINCKEGLYGGALGIPGGIEGAWLIQLDTDKLAIHWYDETILILKKTTRNQKPVASFNCRKAGNEAEKTICGSIALAAYDKSLAKAYTSTLKHLRLEGDKKALQQFKQSQKDWLKRRNACGVDTKCLQQAMQYRLNIIFDR